MWSHSSWTHVQIDHRYSLLFFHLIIYSDMINQIIVPASIGGGLVLSRFFANECPMNRSWILWSGIWFYQTKANARTIAFHMFYYITNYSEHKRQHHTVRFTEFSTKDLQGTQKTNVWLMQYLTALKLEKHQKELTGWALNSEKPATFSNTALL